MTKKLPSSTARGLGQAHRKQRQALLNRHRDGTPCWWCNRPMHRDPKRNWDRRPLEADHTHARSHGGKIADRLLCSTCNRQRGDGTRDHLRPALTGPTDGPTAAWCPGVLTNCGDCINTLDWCGARAHYRPSTQHPTAGGRTVKRNAPPTPGI